MNVVDRANAGFDDATHVTGEQEHEAAARCALGASSLESGNAREATCLNAGNPARGKPDTQQEQLGTDAGSIPASPTTYPATAEPVRRKL